MKIIICWGLLIFVNVLLFEHQREEFKLVLLAPVLDIMQNRPQKSGEFGDVTLISGRMSKNTGL